jgi:hypothetical protein
LHGGVAASQTREQWKILTSLGTIGRAIGVLSGEGKPGLMNFDLEDDPVGHDGGKALIEAVQAGKFGAVL